MIGAIVATSESIFDNTEILKTKLFLTMCNMIFGGLNFTFSVWTHVYGLFPAVFRTWSIW